MLFVLNKNELIIIYLILNCQINKQVIRVILCYPITNWVVFEFVIFDQFIIFVVFGMVTTVQYLLLTQPKHDLLTRITTLIHRNNDSNFHYH